MSLQVTFDGNGLSGLSYNGLSLFAGAFTIWEDHRILNGIVDLGGWGEGEAIGKVWDAANKVATWLFPWGSVSCWYTYYADMLTAKITVRNSGATGETIEGMSLFPFFLQFPSLPAGFVDPMYPQISQEGSGVVGADYGSGMVVSVNESSTDGKGVLTVGFRGLGANKYGALIGSTWDKSDATFRSKFTRPVPPGATDTYTASWRFCASGSDVSVVAADAYARYRAAYPWQVKWTDRRPIGAVILSSCVVSDDKTRPHSISPTNPRNWWNDPAVDVVSPAGVAAFQTRMMQQADTIIAVLGSLNAQGMVIWDPDGEEYPQDTSYLGDPESLAINAPEFDTIADQWFGQIKAAGYKIGCCLRPQELVRALQTKAQISADRVNGNLPQNVPWPVSEAQLDQTVAATIIRKARYCIARWGMSMFYVDSTVNINGGALPAAVWSAVNAALPGVLFCPENCAPAVATWAAPFRNQKVTGSDPELRRIYPEAFSVIYVGDGDLAGGKLAPNADYVAAVKAGDILMGRAWYADAEHNQALLDVYAQSGPPPAPPAVWSISGAPAGLTLSATGLLTGAVAAAGVYALEVAMADDAGKVIQAVTLTVTAAPPPPPPPTTRTITPNAIAAVAGAPISVQFQVQQ